MEKNNIILQHFTGNLRELDKLSVRNIKAYAKQIGCDYLLLTGQVFREHLTPACQKAVLINERFDEYDQVLMLDIDVFVVNGVTEDVFEISGVGIHAKPQTKAKTRLIKAGRLGMRTPYWGGQFYLMDRELRQTLRGAMPSNDKWMDIYNVPCKIEDEGILSELAYRAGVKGNNHYINQKWCQCSYLPNPEWAKMIHVRTKITPKGPYRAKINNYQSLVVKGVLSQMKYL